MLKIESIKLASILNMSKNEVQTQHLRVKIVLTDSNLKTEALKSGVLI